MVDLIEGLYLVKQEARREVVQPVGRIRVAKDNHEGPVEVSAAVDLQLVGEGVSGEFVVLTLQKKNVEACKAQIIFPSGVTSAYLAQRCCWPHSLRLCARSSF